MQILTFLTPEGTTYCATAPRSGSDMAVPDKPADMPLAEFDRDAGEWIEPLAAVKARAVERIDANTSARILAGFEFQPEGQDAPLHFSYDRDDQRNFADAANAALLAQAGTPGVPESVDWNAYRTDTGELVRLTLVPTQFLALYVAGALAHKAACMEAGGAKKAAVEAAATAEEVAAVLAS